MPLLNVHRHILVVSKKSIHG